MKNSCRSLDCVVLNLLLIALGMLLIFVLVLGIYGMLLIFVFSPRYLWHALLWLANT